MKEWECQCCGYINKVMQDELELEDEFNCEKCHGLHIIEQMCNGEITVEMF